MLDCHCHIDQFKNPRRLVAEAAKRGVFIVGVTNLPSHFQIGLPHTREMQNVRLAIGMHPLAASEHAAERERFREALAFTSYVGEIGLDFSREGIGTREIQVETFRFVSECLKPLKKVVSLHSRRAESAVLEILSEFEIGPVVFHWYSGPLNVLESAQKLGHYFSVNPEMIRSTSGQRIIERISPDRMLTESDGPHTKIGKSWANPWDIERVESHIATVWNVDHSDVRSRVWLNFNQLLHRTGVIASGLGMPEGESSS